MAYKNNLLEYYGGGSVPYRQGYQGGGKARKVKRLEGPVGGYPEGSKEKWGPYLSRRLGIFENGEQVESVVPPNLKYYDEVMEILYEQGLTPGTDRMSGPDMQGEERKLQKYDPSSATFGPTKDMDYIGFLGRNMLLEDMYNLEGYDKDVRKALEGVYKGSPKWREIDAVRDNRKTAYPSRGYQEGGYMPSWKDYKAGVGSARLMESAGEDPLSDIKLGLGAAGTIPDMAGIASDVASAGLSIGQGKFKEGIGSLVSAADPTGFLGAAQTGMSLWDRFSGKQYGGEVQYMQGGGFPDFASIFQPSGGRAKIARAGKLRKAYKDVGRRARQIGKKQGLSRFLGTVGELGGKFIGSAFGPAGSAIGAGLGRGLGSMLGYGKKVGAGASKWLSGAREQLRSSESGIGKSFLEQGLASGIKTGVVGAIDSGAFKDLGDKFKTKLGTLRHGESPVAGVGESLKTSEYGKVLSQDPSALTVDKFKAMRPKDPFEYAGKTSLVPNVEAISASAPTQLDMPLRGAGFDFTDPFSASDVQQASFGEYGGKFPEHLKWENFDPYQLTSGGRDRGEYGFQGGGYVRDDMALLDMIYRR